MASHHHPARRTRKPATVAEQAARQIARVAQTVATDESAWRRQYDREQTDLKDHVLHPSKQNTDVARVGWRGVSQLANRLSEWALKRRSPSDQQPALGILDLAGYDDTDVSTSQRTLHELLDVVAPAVPDSVMRMFSQQPADLRALTLAHAASRAAFEPPRSNQHDAFLSRMWDTVTILQASPLPFGMRLWIVRMLYEVDSTLVHTAIVPPIDAQQSNAKSSSSSSSDSAPKQTASFALCVQDTRTRLLFVRLMGIPAIHLTEDTHDDKRHHTATTTTTTTTTSQKQESTATPLMQWFVHAVMETSMFEHVDREKGIHQLDDSLFRKLGDAVRSIMPAELHSPTLEQFLQPAYWIRHAASMSSAHLQNGDPCFASAEAVLLLVLHMLRVLLTVHASSAVSWSQVRERHESGILMLQQTIRDILLPVWMAIAPSHVRLADVSSRVFGGNVDTTTTIRRHGQDNLKLRDEIVHLARVLHLHSIMTLMQLRRSMTLFFILLTASPHFPSSSSSPIPPPPPPSLSVPVPPTSSSAPRANVHASTPSSSKFRTHHHHHRRSHHSRS